MRKFIYTNAAFACPMALLFILLYPQYNFAQKRHLKKSDYYLWGTMYIDKLSDDGKWVSFQMDYDEAPDTLFVESTDGKKQFKFAGVNTGEFGGGHWFSFQRPDNSLALLTLSSGSVLSTPPVKSFAFSANGGYLVTLGNGIDDELLQVYDRSGTITAAISGVKGFKLSPDGREMVFSTEMPNKSTVEWLCFGASARPVGISEAGQGAYESFEWQDNSASVAFIHHVTSSASRHTLNDVYVYNVKSKTTRKISDEVLRKAAPGMRISDPRRSRLSISHNGSKVLFGVDPVQKEIRFSPDSIQVWNGNDKWTYPERKNYSLWEDMAIMVSWAPATNDIVVINEGRPQIFFSAEMEYAISYNEMEFGPQYKPSASSNHYITDLNTGETTLWLPEAGPGEYDFSISPAGKYLAYYREGNYWIYDFASQKHINVTHGTNADWRDEESSTNEKFGIAGWSEGDRFLLLHDKYDLFKIDLNTGQVKRLTDGRENRCTCRSVRTEPNTSVAKFNLFARSPLNLKAPIPVIRKCHTESSFLLIRPDGESRQVTSGEIHISDILKANNREAFIYISQRYDKPPSLHFAYGRNSLTLFNSNTVHEQFLWGRSEEINYKNAEGISLKGLLTYPAGYDASKRYPVVVFVYEDQFRAFHQYVNPSQYNMIGFNVSNLASQDYFVLRPDIVYVKGNPGLSAADCTIAAVNALLEKNIVEPTKIGLIGQSFGGYETNFIITQTGLFAAAVSGASVADLRSHYLSIGWNNGQPEIFRFENQQWRMGKSLFEDREGYDRNSPVSHVASITTPLFLWSGEMDRQVHFHQSIAFYLALRRLGKEQVMVLYPHQGHAITSPMFQADLTARTEDWFGHYLKGETKGWISNGTK